MKECLQREILFDYVHNSLEKDLMKNIDQHIAKCSNCQEILGSIKNEIFLIKKSLDYINPKLKEIPNSKSIKISKSKKILKYTKMLSLAASICLLITISALAVMKIIQNPTPVNDYELFEYIPDMNDAWQNNSIIVTLYDDNGNPVKHQLIGNNN